MHRHVSRVEGSETERKKMEEELSIVYDALNSSVSAVIITNLEGQIKYINSTFLKMFAYEEKMQILGENAAELFPTEKVTKFADVKAIIDKTKGETEEFTAQRKDGTRFPAEVSSSNVTDDAGNILGRMASFIDLTERNRAQKAVQESKRQIRALSSNLLEAEEKERKRIARDLHDIIGSSLTAIKYGMEKQIAEMSKNATTEGTSLAQLVSMIKDTIKETKRISRSLRPSVLDDLGILATISWSCREFQKIYTAIRIEKLIEIEESEVPESLKTVIYKLLQEALNNIAKHSRANHIRLGLTKTEKIIALSVEDNGRGFEPKVVFSDESYINGLGLASMKERTELFGGSFEIFTSKGKGTTIRASWPCG